MYRFMALHWNERRENEQHYVERLDQVIQQRFPAWRLALAIEGLRIYDNGATAERMDAHLVQSGTNPRPAGAILGLLFNRPPSDGCLEHSPIIDNHRAREIVQTGGRFLTEHFWGRYVAFIADRVRRRVYVLRAPMGDLPCFFMRDSNVHIFFSYMPDIEQLGQFRFSTNWEHVAAFVGLHGSRTGETGLREVHELLPGECRVISPTETTLATYWDPARIAHDTAFEQPVEASQALRLTTQACVASWASRYRRICHNLSGGLDSSIVLRCLQDAPNHPDIRCLNLYSPERESDERYYARLAAGAADVPLLELPAKSRDIRLSRWLKVAKGPSPENYLFERPHNYLGTRWVEERAIDACFYGSGGDNVFFQPHTRLGAIDYVLKRGLNRGIYKAAMDAAQLDRSSIWSVLRSAFAARITPHETLPFHMTFPKRPSLIPADIWDALDKEKALPRSLREGGPLPPGKAFHLSIATNCPSYYEPLEPQESFLERVMPLFSQPIVELCLQIPIWTLTTGGRDRGLARMAFADRLPPQILARESKGGADKLIDTVFAEHKDFIADLLLDGVLAQQRLLDRQRLEQVIRRRDMELDAEIVNLLFLLCAEVWARHWNEAGT